VGQAVPVQSAILISRSGRFLSERTFGDVIAGESVSC
jgi:hypothetical protein